MMQGGMQQYNGQQMVCSTPQSMRALSGPARTPPRYCVAKSALAEWAGSPDTLVLWAGREPGGDV